MKRKPCLLAVLLLPLLSCRPGADFKVSVRVIDEATGQPIPDAWVLAAVAVKVEPEREPPYNRAVAGTRGKTDRKGIATFEGIEGIYWGEEPQDKLWLMLESRKPKVKRRITLIKEGDLFVFAKDYGALHHPLHFKGTPQEHAGMGPFGIRGEDEPILLDPSELKDGAILTVKMAKPDKEYLYGSFHPDTFLPAIWAATSKKTGATKAEKRAIYDFFVRNLAPLDRDRPDGAYRGHIKPEALLDPEVTQRFVNHAPARDQGTAVQEWVAQEALELLPGGYEEVKVYAQEILAGVRAEEEGDRPLNHYYDPTNPDKAIPGGETALKWGAIGYPDNPRNDWDWEDALRYYRAGQMAKAYRALGHVAHLLADMAVLKPEGLAPELLAVDEITRTPGGPAFATTIRERFEGLARRRGDSRTAVSAAVAHAAGIYLDFAKRIHPPEFVKGPGKGDAAAGAPSANAALTDAPTRIAPTPTPEEQARKRLGEWKALLEECRQGKRGDEDRYFILRGMLWTYDRLKERETPDGQAVLKELIELRRQRPDIKKKPPEALSEALIHRITAQTTLANTGTTPFAPSDSRAVSIYQSGDKAAVVFQYRIEFYSLPKGARLQLPKDTNRRPSPPAIILDGKDSGAIGAAPNLTMRFKRPISVSPWVAGQGDVEGPIWACTELFRNYSPVDDEEQSFINSQSGDGQFHWAGATGEEDFCGAVDISGRVVYRLPIQQHFPDSLLDLRDVSWGGKAALILLGELTEGADGEGEMKGNFREILIWTPPNELRRFDVGGMTDKEISGLRTKFGFSGPLSKW